MEKGKTKDLLSFLIKYWDNKVSPINSIKEQDNLLKNKILAEVVNDAIQYKKLEDKGEYSVKYLILMAKLLMFQEKTNYNKAYMFRNLLVELEKGKDIFKIIGTATHR